MARLVSSGTDAFESSGDLERIKDLFRPDPAQHPGNLRCNAEEARKEPDNGQIPLLELRNVSYGYGLKSEPVVVDFTAKLGRGKKTSIVGISGSGKSTIAKLAAGLLPPWGGNVLVDGKVIQKIPGASGIIAYVGQEPSLFEGTVSDNIRLWSKAISEADAIRAASDARANDFILARKAGYSAIVEMDGANFSGGEAQMIDIARALATNPALMILDEATGYVAPETEKEIFHNILERGISMLVISQRIETVADSDEIIVLERGTIVQKGRHEELMSTDGTYRTLMIKEKADTGIAGQAPEKHIYLPGTIREIAGSGKLPSQTNSQRCDGDALLAASSVVFGHLGLKATQVKMKDSVHRPVQDTVLEIEQLCKPFSLRARKIGLKEGWWKQDCGPMLGFTRDDNSPIAIVPRRWGGYCAMNPKDGNSWFIADSQSSDCIGKEAYQFYRCLPSGECMSKFQIQTLARVPFDLFLAFFSGMAGIFITIAMSLAIAFQMSLTLSAGESPGILQLLLILVSGSVPATLLCLLQSRVAYRVKCKNDMSLHCALFDRLLSMPSELRRKLRLPELASGYLRATFLRGKMVNAFIHMTTSFLLGICSLGFLFLVNWRFGIMAVIVHVFFIAIYLSSLIWLPHLREKIGEYEKRQCRKVAQIVHSIAKIRSTGTGMHFFESWLEDFSAAQKKFVAEERIVAGFEGITAFLPMFACSIVIFWTLSEPAHLHIGRLLIINAALVTSLAAMAYTMATLVKTCSTQFELKMHEAPLVVKREIEKEEETLHTDIPGNWDIELKDISFRYDPGTLPILDSISLRIEAGKFNVIYGEPGTGKSAIARILMGLERPEKGKISINGHCLDRISGDTLRRKIAGITQGAKLPPGTIFDAIAGTSGLGLDEAWEAAGKALCLGDIERMPAQMLTRVIAGGIAFSAGQRQRILIASIFVRKPSLIVLDESLNAVDPLSRSLILDNLMGLGSTIVCISHQRDILAKADKTLIVSKTS
jgi:ATP-binding cassette subfamily C protein